MVSLGVFVAVFFGAPQVVKKITGKEACCLYEGQTMEDGKCVAAPGYDFVGTDKYILPDGSGFSGCGVNKVFNNKRECVPPGSPLWK